VVAEKTLYMLIGPKGVGKTHVGSLVDRNTDIEFIRVESIWLGLRDCEDGWEAVEAAIDLAFRSHDGVMIESLGAGPEFRSFHASLARKYTIKLICVRAGADTCLERVRGRSRNEHLSASDEDVARYNRVAAAVEYDWDLVIENDPAASDSDILASIESLRSR
jgi:predicted ABC-type ATPase